MKILIINAGSSSVKFQLIDVVGDGAKPARHKPLASGSVQRIGNDATCSFSTAAGASLQEQAPVVAHEDAVAKIVSWLDSAGLQQISGNGRAFDAIAHRVVHGGERFVSPVLLDDPLIANLEELNELAPLHNPAAIKAIQAARRLLGSSMPSVAVFDTAFHHAIPRMAATYAIPVELSRKHRIRRYGFHGLAHQYSLMRYGELTGTPKEKATIITLHLGNGCSACAIQNGASVDTSMGFTPLEGLMMGTRCGDLDPAVVPYLVDREGVSAEEVEAWLNERSGLLGVSGLSNDMREVAGSYDSNECARLAVDMFCYRARKYVGAYLAALGGADAVVFSGGIGENNPMVRAMICTGMEWCGLRLDDAANTTAIGRDAMIAAPEAALKVFVVRTDEEIIIAREAASLITAVAAASIHAL